MNLPIPIRPRLAVSLTPAVFALWAMAAPVNAAVQFDGTNDYVTFGSAAPLGASQFTLEAWIKRTGIGVTTSTGTGGVTAMPLIAKGRAEADGTTADMNYFLGIRADSILVADYEEGTGQTSPGLNHPIVGTTVLRSQVWYHVAVTFDGTTMRLYVNGNLDGTLAVGASRLPQSASIQHAGLGTAMTSAGTAAGFFAGVLDEARIWNVARTQAELQGALGSELTSGTGLIGRWSLDDGAGTSAANSIAGSPAGTLTNGPAWVAGAPFSTNYGLLLNGTNSFATFGNAAALGLPQFTLETWFRRDGAGVSTSTGSGGVTDCIPLVAKGRAEADGSNLDMNYILGIRASDGVLVADFEEGAGGASPGLNHPVAGVTPVGTGAWHHAAATYDGTTWKLYLDGVLENSLAVGQPPQSASIQHASLGSALNSTGVAAGFFLGALDEARVWNVARTLAELQGAANTPLTGSVPGLVGRWGMNEAAGTVIASSAGGTLNGSIAGTGFNWTQGAPFNLVFGPPPVPADPTGLSATAPDYNRVDLSWTDNASDETGFEVEVSTSGAGGPFAPLGTTGVNVTTYTHQPVAAASGYCYRVRAVNGGGPSNWTPAACATTPAEPNRALDFDGSGGYVTFGTAPSLNAATFTVECWFRRDAAGTGTNTGSSGIPDAIPLVSKGRAETETAATDLNYLLGIRASDGVLCADFEEGAAGANPSLNHPIFGTTAIAANGSWHHAAVTYDGATLSLYLDGCLERSLAVGQPPASATTAHASVGSALNSTGVAAGAFAGAIDEVRIWGAARSAGDVRGGMLGPVAPASSGLLGRWGFNEASGTVAWSAPGPNGTLGGAGTTRIPGSPFGDPLPPVAAVTFPNGGENLDIGSLATLQWTATDCFGVTQVDLLLSRNGSAGPWEPIASGIPNSGSFAWTVTSPAVAANALLRVVASDGTSSVSDESDAPFTIFDAATATTLAMFACSPVGEGVEVAWAFSEATDVRRLSLERAEQPAAAWSAVWTSSADRLEGRVVDREAEAERAYWYRLRAEMADGTAALFGPVQGVSGAVRALALELPAPNPAQESIELRFALPKAATVRLALIDVQGREWARLAEGAFAAGRHRVSRAIDRNVPTGLYFLRLEAGGETRVRRLGVVR